MVMQTTAATSRAALIRQIVQGRYEIDMNFPPWARRSHPIVRRHLGIYWRVMTPQFESAIHWYLAQAALVILTYPFPFLMTVILPMVIVSAALLPFMLIYYVRALYDVALDASRSMVSEIENATLPLLLTTPYPLREILLCKIAGSMWRQSEALILITGAAVFTQMPTLVLIYMNRFPPADYGILSQGFMVAVMAVTIIRIPVEMFMTAALGHYIGATTSGKSTAAGTTLTLVAFYFLLINLPRLLQVAMPVQAVIDIALPLLVPVLLSYVFIRMTEYHLANND